MLSRSFLRGHILPAEQEALLAGASEIFGSSADTFSIMNNADLKFPVVKNDEGEDVQLTHGVYGQLLESTNRNVREQAFKSLYSVYHQFRNTFASTLSHMSKGITTRLRSVDTALLVKRL